MANVYLLLYILLPLPTQGMSRTEACMMLVGVDDTVVELFNNDEKLIRNKVKDSEKDSEGEREHEAEEGYG